MSQDVDPQNNGPQHTLSVALVAMASAERLGDRTPWEGIKVTISQLLEDPYGETDMRDCMLDLNDPNVARTLKSWFKKFRKERRMNGADAARGDEKVLNGLQNAAVTVGAGAIGFTLLKAVAFSVTWPVIAMAAFVYGVVAYGRWRLSKRSDAANDDVELLDDYIELFDQKIKGELSR
ncbi:hypothetical protein [Ruegeria profundi]|nr:hypothetical protein [Ruegeria profundi]